MTLKSLTLNDLEMPFYAKIGFHRRLTGFFCLNFNDNYEKTNEDTPMLSATKMLPMILVSGDIRLLLIFVRVLARRRQQWVGRTRSIFLTNRYFTAISSFTREPLQIDTDLLLIITSTTDELSGGTNIDDFERP